MWIDVGLASACGVTALHHEARLERVSVDIYTKGEVPYSPLVYSPKQRR